MKTIKFQYLTIILLLLLGQSSLVYGTPSFLKLSEVPAELKELKSSFRASRIHRQFHLDFKEITFEEEGGKFRMVLPLSKPVLSGNMPELQARHYSWNVSAKKEYSVVLKNQVIEESLASLPIETLPPTYLWSDIEQGRLHFPKNEIDRYYPGSFFRSYQRQGTLHLSIFPVQVDRFTGKTVVLRSVDVVVEEKPIEIHFSLETLLMNPSLILTSEKNSEAAEKLKRFHEEVLNVKSDIVTVEQIAKSENPVSEKDLPDGYKTEEGREDSVITFDPIKNQGYNYELARKIISYMQKRMTADSPLRYLTLLGSAEEIPPSYYYATKDSFGRNFAPTDWCYAAIDQCLTPKLAIGRLPLKNTIELENYLLKARKWLTQKTHSELSLFGGKAFSSSRVYVGELSTQHPISTENSDWNGVNKKYRTLGNYNKKEVNTVFSGRGDTSFVYYLDHGRGNELYVEKEFTTAKELLELPAFTGDYTVPIFASIACIDGAYDETLVQEKILGGKIEKSGAVSVGVAALKSKAGVVAYVGMTRVALGSPNFKVDGKGNLTLKGNSYGIQILDHFFDYYRKNRKARLGDAFLNAVESYAHKSGNNMKESEHKWSYFISTLLGDPLLPLPLRVDSENNLPFGNSLTTFEDPNSSLFPEIKVLDEKTLNLHFELNSLIRFQLFKMSRGEFGEFQGEELIADKEINQPNFEIPLELGSEESSSDYFIRLENKIGVKKERQVWFRVRKD